VKAAIAQGEREFIHGRLDSRVQSRSVPGCIKLAGVAACDDDDLSANAAQVKRRVVLFSFLALVRGLRSDRWGPPKKLAVTVVGLTSFETWNYFFKL